MKKDLRKFAEKCEDNRYMEQFTCIMENHLINITARYDPDTDPNTGDVYDMQSYIVYIYGEGDEVYRAGVSGTEFSVGCGYYDFERTFE